MKYLSIILFGSVCFLSGCSGGEAEEKNYALITKDGVKCKAGLQAWDHQNAPVKILRILDNNGNVEVEWGAEKYVIERQCVDLRVKR